MGVALAAAQVKAARGGGEGEVPGGGDSGGGGGNCRPMKTRFRTVTRPTGPTYPQCGGSPGPRRGAAFGGGYPPPKLDGISRRNMSQVQ